MLWRQEWKVPTCENINSLVANKDAPGDNGPQAVALQSYRHTDRRNWSPQTNRLCSRFYHTDPRRQLANCCTADFFSCFVLFAASRYTTFRPEDCTTASVHICKVSCLRDFLSKHQQWQKYSHSVLPQKRRLKKKKSSGQSKRTDSTPSSKKVKLIKCTL